MANWKNELATTTQAPTDILGGLWSSITAETQDERLQIYDAVSNSMPLDDMVGKTIAISDVILQPTEVTDNATGELENRTRIVLITPEGDAYGCMSTGVETSIKNLFGIVGTPPWEPAITMEVVKKQGRNGYKFTSQKKKKKK